MRDGAAHWQAHGGRKADELTGINTRRALEQTDRQTGTDNPSDRQSDGQTVRQTAFINN